MATPSIEVQELQSGRQRKGKSSIAAVGGSSRHRMNRDEYELIIGYLKDPIQLAEILGSSKKTKIADDGPFHSDVIPSINAKTTSLVDLSEEEYEDDLIADRDGDDVEIHLPAEDDIFMDASTHPSVNP
ncbi:hypothetical protein R1flu_010729 [Riccia fluitans]|uniref:Uncharacterized protein n=1 Tax=Riccia fluitans TaxID=41844 RepID=A0ABD1Z9Y9_9MARC